MFFQGDQKIARPAFLQDEPMFGIHQSPFDQDGEPDDQAAAEYVDGLINAFAESPEGQAFTYQQGAASWTSIFLEYGLSYLGEIPPEMSRHSVEEIVFDIFPRKISTEPDTAPQAIAELVSFWQFLHREYELAGAAEILQRLDGAEEELKSELGDRANFGMAKAVLMQAQEAGFDMSTQEGAAQFLAAYNAGLTSEGPTTGTPPPGPVRPAEKLSRNQRRARQRELRRRMKRSGGT